MDESLTGLYAAIEESKKIQEELDKRIFHLRTLSDLNSELSPLIRTEGLIDRFLLVTMGTLGVSQGFVLVYDRETKTVRTAARGIEWAVGLSGEAAERLLYKAFEGSEARSLAPMTATRINNPCGIFSDVGIPMDVTFGILYVIDQRSLGLVMYGPTVSGALLSREEEDLLLTHTAGFMVFLKNAGSFETIEALNKDLIHRNEELSKTIAELTEAKHTIALLERARIHIKALVQRELERIGRVSPLDLAVIFVMATILGILFNLANPQGLRLIPDALRCPLSERVGAVEAMSLLASGSAVLVDARPKELFGQKHIKGAINVPSALFDIIYMMKLSKLDEKKEIIVYGRTVSKLYDEEVAHRLRLRDHEKVRVLSGGLEAWESRGYEVE